jgi:RecA-family ATPase
MKQEQRSENELVRCALKYAGWGLRVFPLHSVHEDACTCSQPQCHSAGKHPRTKNGVKDATTDHEQIRLWWEKWPNANIGIATGLYNGRGLYVIDVDSAKGASFDSLENCDLSELLCSRIARTGSGGYHIYLQCSTRLPNTTNRLGAYIDTRGEGGYVVAPPSHNAYGPYVWETAFNRILPMPPALLARLGVTTTANDMTSIRKKEAENHEISHAAQTSETKTSAALPSANAAPADAASALPQTGVASEARNTFLVSMAGTLRHQGLNVDEIRAALLGINEQRYGRDRHPQGPLSLDEMERTIFKSIAKWEKECGVQAAKLPLVEQLADLIGRVIPEPHWLIPGLLCEGLVLLAGKPKLGKSWLALALALALTCAQRIHNQDSLALGRYPVNPASVLYLSLEDSAIRLQRRVNKLRNGQEVPPKFAFALKWKPLLAGGLNNLDTMLISLPDTRLVVIDTLARVRTQSMSTGNMYQEDYTLMAALQELVVRHHLTLILVHHTRKMASSDTFDEISGSTGLTGAADTSIVLKRQRNRSEATLHLTGRDIEEQEVALNFNTIDCTWTATGSVEERQVSQSRQAILDLFEQNGAMTPMEVADALEKPYDTIKSTLRRMAQEREIVKKDRGQYTLPPSTRSSLFGQTEDEAAD